MNGSAEQNRPFTRTALYYGLIVLICLLIGLIDGYRSHITSFEVENGGFGVDLDTALLSDVSGWSVWIVLIPVIFYLCRRYPVTQKNWHRRILPFLLLGFLFSLIRTLFPFLVSVIYSRSSRSLDWLSSYYFYLSTDYLIAFVFYSVILTLGQAVNFYRRYREEEFRVLQLESQLSKAQIQALKMQLHPHFLFNALNSISAMQLKDLDVAQEMTARLGDFLRLTLENVGTQDVTLEQEIKFLKCYLDIERVRFENGLDANVELHPETRFCQIPNLILQPLVENAIKHGIVPLKTKGVIDISATRERKWLKIEIRDNGVGLDSNVSTNSSSTGLGLSNTRERLQRLYGKNFQFEIENSADDGTLIRLCLPYRVSEEPSLQPGCM